MDTKKYISYSAEEFVTDDNFIRYTYAPTEEDLKFWSDFQLNNAGKRRDLEEARAILSAIQPVEPEIQDGKLDSMFQAIHSSTRKRKIVLLMMRNIAAIFVVASFIGGYFFWYQNRTELPFKEITRADGIHGRIQLYDGTVKEFDTDQTRIEQSSDGVLSVNNDTVKKSNVTAKAGIAMNTIIIPYGTRSQLILPDGSKIWLNSGTQFSYPVQFSDDKREVFLSGEAFFDVKPMAKPFVVVTKEMKIKVFGTRFNVTSFPEDKTVEAVLVTGKISAERKSSLSKPVNMVPGERVVLDKSEGSMVKGVVETDLYASWIDGYLLFKNEPLPNIMSKLTRCYNKEIVLDASLNGLTFSGKLDMIDNLDRLLENISFITPFEISGSDEGYTIKAKTDVD